jgi:hypothetical protein
MQLADEVQKALFASLSSTSDHAPGPADWVVVVVGRVVVVVDRVVVVTGRVVPVSSVVVVAPGGEGVPLDPVQLGTLRSTKGVP